MKESTHGNASQHSRRKLLLGLGFLSLVPLRKLNFFWNGRQSVDCAPENQKTTIKLLGQDGKLVEVDISKIESTRQHVSNEELKTWVKVNRPGSK